MQALIFQLRLRFGLTWGVRPKRFVSTHLYFAKRALILILAIFSFVSFSSISEYADAANEATLREKQAAASLDPALSIISKCLTKGDNPIYIGDELWFVGATPTGIKRKETK